MGKTGRKRRARKRQAPEFRPENSILFRPDDVAHRRQFGHWEADLMIFRKEHGPANVATVVERKSRFTVLFRNNDRRSKPLMGRLPARAPAPKRPGRA